MGDLDWNRVETIVDQALELPEEERATFIEQKCQGDEQLKGEITTLLESISCSEGWLENPKNYQREFYQEIADDVELLSSGRNLIDTQVGSYLIKEKIGEGGMGAVYLAERSADEFEHRVAIKIIRQGQASKENLQRFKREQQILAGLNHPGIAQFYDGGVTVDGFPYIIMEYVDGVPIDEYCRRSNIDLDEKIELFKKVLEAVRYAHENLVIHRDLKPGNILVNSDGKIKILDFGISKLLESESHESSLTLTGARLLTPRYAAPEQVKQQNITTATDLYALGIVFYELAAGSGPYDLENQSPYEIEQIILETNPKKPSARTQIPGRSQKLYGDLDAVILKALRKQPENRYRLANEFLDDLSNYQQGLPVSAQEGTFQYRAHKFFKRHKQGAAAVVGILLLIIGLTGFYTWRITEERNQAQFEAERAQQIKEFMLSMFDRSNPDMANYSGREQSTTEMLIAGMQKVEDELSNRPEMHIEMLASIGDALSNIDEFEKADQALTKALIRSRKYYGANSHQTADILSDLANYNHEIQQYEEAENYILEALAIDSTINGEHSESLSDKISIYASNQFLQSNYHRARQLFLEADSLDKVFGRTQTPGYHTMLANLGETELFLGEYQQAENHFLQALNFYTNYYDSMHVNIAMTQYRLGMLHHYRSEYKKAETYLLKSLDGYKTLYGAYNSQLSSNYAMLARTYRLLGDLDQAHNYALKDADLTKTLFSDTSAMYAKSLNNLAMMQKAQGQLKAAKNNYEQSLLLYQQHLDSDNPDLAMPLYNLADVLMDLGNYDRSHDLIKRVVEIDKAKLGPRHPEVGIDLNKMGAILTKAGHFAQADSVFAEAEGIFLGKFPENHYRIGEYFVNCGILNLKQQNHKEASNYFKQAIEIFNTNFKEDNRRIAQAMAYLKKSQQAAVSSANQ
ncbi:serine/threonine-protein kinase [Aliifodinibius sp. S!AR15-10]|uniref:serine/threonine-protein kinase n=1 Tax=Aliifodinibius sp. S!AR15-10 TaxID=2950437 RepID=UPI00285FBAE8|nr:serine/threonine-protein kinase [Aliifodinibius sp. S!AR15-10]MDR8391773.1 serine/threonine-protein kinase [Aliifodinibius sp. S!AR15-10]